MKAPCVAIIVFGLAGILAAQNKPVQRPRITGIDHACFYTTDPEAVKKLYAGTLGLAEATPVEPGQKWRYMVGSQWVGYSPAPDPKSQNRLDHFAYRTDDILTLHTYLVQEGLEPGPIQKRSDESRSFTVKDPEGYLVEFVQHAKKEAKPNAPASASSHRLIHAGVIVKSAAAEDKFYREILGFRPYWHGGWDSSRTDWVSLQVPDGTDWFEYMLNIKPSPDLRESGMQNHISLGVANMDAAEAILRSHGWAPHDGEKQQDGLDGKKQLNVFDPEFVRVELMEFKPFKKPCCSDFQGKHPSETE